MEYLAKYFKNQVMWNIAVYSIPLLLYNQAAPFKKYNHYLHYIIPVYIWHKTVLPDHCNKKNL